MAGKSGEAGSTRPGDGKPGDGKPGDGKPGDGRSEDGRSGAPKGGPSTLTTTLATTLATIRTRVAQLLWLLFVVCALFLAVGALLVALKANVDNPLVAFVLDGADAVDLGVFSRENGIKEFTGDNADIKNALVNWGIGAVAYLVVGRIVDRIIRP